MARPSLGVIAVIALAALIARLYVPVKTKSTTAGFGRPRDSLTPIHGDRLVHIPNTFQCEDLHHHEPSNLLFTACEEGKLPEARRKWFPPLAAFDARHSTGRGSLVVIDPKTMKSKHLTLEAFVGPFITHGIDILTSPSDSSTIYIFAINHLAHPEANKPTQAQKAISRVEIFSHTLGSTTAQHIRSVAHPNIRTPNDIYAISPTSFYVTNDHHYRDGPMRILEDLGWRGVAGWSDTQHVTFDAQDPTGNANSTAGVTSVTALTGLHNNNGLGHGETPETVLIGSAASGELTRLLRNVDSANDPELEVLEHIQMDSFIDNPTYFRDRYTVTPQDDTSGYVMAGLARGVDIMDDLQDPNGVIPVVVWHVKPNVTVAEMGEKRPRGVDPWTRKMIFRDDGKVASGAATAVLVGADPMVYEGGKKAWLFVTGFLSKSVVASLIDLED